MSEHGSKPDLDRNTGVASGSEHEGTEADSALDADRAEPETEVIRLGPLTITHRYTGPPPGGIVGGALGALLAAYVLYVGSEVFGGDWPWWSLLLAFVVWVPAAAIGFVLITMIAVSVLSARPSSQGDDRGVNSTIRAPILFGVTALAAFVGSAAGIIVLAAMPLLYAVVRIAFEAIDPENPVLIHTLILAAIPLFVGTTLAPFGVSGWAVGHAISFTSERIGQTNLRVETILVSSATLAASTLIIIVDLVLASSLRQWIEDWMNLLVVILQYVLYAVGIAYALIIARGIGRSARRTR